MPLMYAIGNSINVVIRKSSLKDNVFTTKFNETTGHSDIVPSKQIEELRLVCFCTEWFNLGQN